MNITGRNSAGKARGRNTLLVAILLLVIVFGWTKTTFAAGPNPNINQASDITDALSAGGAATVLSAPSFLDDASYGWVQKLWEYLRKFSNILIVIFLFAASVATTLNLNVNTYGVKKVLPAVITGALLSNFSFFLTKVFISVDNALRAAFLGASSNHPQGGATFFLKALEPLTSASWDAKTADKNWIGMFFVPLTGSLIIGFALLTIFAVILLLWVRNLFLGIMIFLAPVAFLAMAFPATQGVFKKWWSEFIRWMFVPTIVSFFVMVAAVVADAVPGKFIALLLVGIAYYAAFRVPFMLGGLVGAVGGYIMGQFKPTGRAGLYMPGVSTGVRAWNTMKKFSDADIKRLTTGPIVQRSGVRSYLNRPNMFNKAINKWSGGRFTGTVSIGDRPTEAQFGAPQKPGANATKAQLEMYANAREVWENGPQKPSSDAAYPDQVMYTFAKNRWESEGRNGVAFAQAERDWELLREGTPENPKSAPILPERNVDTPPNEYQSQVNQWLDRYESWMTDPDRTKEETAQAQRYFEYQQALNNPYNARMKAGISADDAISGHRFGRWLNNLIAGNLRNYETAGLENEEAEKRAQMEALDSNDDTKERIARLKIAQQEVADTVEAIEKQAQASVLGTDKIIRQEKELARQRKFIAENQLKLVDNELIYEGQNKNSALHQNLQRKLQTTLSQIGISSLSDSYSELGMRAKIAEESIQASLDEVQTRKADRHVRAHNLAYAIKKGGAEEVDKLTGDEKIEMDEFLSTELGRAGFQATGNTALDSRLYLASEKDFADPEENLFKDLGVSEEVKQRVLAAREPLTVSSERHVAAWKRAMGIQGAMAAKGRETAEKYVTADGRWAAIGGGENMDLRDYNEENLKRYLMGEVQLGEFSDEDGVIGTDRADQHSKKLHDFNANLAVINQAVRNGNDVGEFIPAARQLTKLFSIANMPGLSLLTGEQGKVNAWIRRLETEDLDDNESREMIRKIQRVLRSPARAEAIGVKGVAGKSGTPVGEKRITLPSSKRRAPAPPRQNLRNSSSGSP